VQPDRQAQAARREEGCAEPQARDDRHQDRQRPRLAARQVREPEQQCRDGQRRTTAEPAFEQSKVARKQSSATDCLWADWRCTGTCSKATEPLSRC
jgi:hypothetical protein